MKTESKKLKHFPTEKLINTGYTTGYTATPYFNPHSLATHTR